MRRPAPYVTISSRKLSWRHIRLVYKPYFSSQQTVFFSHNKSANDTFNHGFSAKRTGFPGRHGHWFFFKSLTCMQWRPHISTASALRMCVVYICALCMCAYISRQNGFSTRTKYLTFCLFIFQFETYILKTFLIWNTVFFKVFYVFPVRMNRFS
jgi:hypothetical protein